MRKPGNTTAAAPFIALVAALEKAIAFGLVMVPFTQAAGYPSKHPEVVRINPKKQVPLLVHGEAELFDSRPIVKYLEDMNPAPRLWLADVAG